MTFATEFPACSIVDAWVWLQDVDRRLQTCTACQFLHARQQSFRTKSLCSQYILNRLAWIACSGGCIICRACQGMQRGCCSFVSRFAMWKCTTLNMQREDFCVLRCWIRWHYTLYRTNQYSESFQYETLQTIKNRDRTVMKHSDEVSQAD